VNNLPEVAPYLKAEHRARRGLFGQGSVIAGKDAAVGHISVRPAHPGKMGVRRAATDQQPVGEAGGCAAAGPAGGRPFVAGGVSIAPGPEYPRAGAVSRLDQSRRPVLPTVRESGWTFGHVIIMRAGSRQ